MGINRVAGGNQGADQLRVLFNAHAAKEEGRACLRRFKCRDQMRRAGGVRPVIEGDGDAAFAAAIRIAAANDRRPMPERDAKRDQGSTSTLAVSVPVLGAVSV
jgi:hypothetical protein